MRAVHVDDVVPESQPWGSRRRVLTSLVTLVVTWVSIYVAVNVLHLPTPILVGLGVVAVAVLIGADVVRWRRRRRPRA